MPDIDVLEIIKVNIHCIGTEQTGDSDNCCANRPAAQRDNTKQETYTVEKCYTNIVSISKSNNKNKPMVNNQLSNTGYYFLLGPNYDNKKKSAEITQQLKRDFEDVFNGIGCIGAIFSLQLKPDSKPYQARLRCMAYVLQNLLRRS